MTAEHRHRPARPESREVAELREVRAAHPELAPAVDMQIELMELVRRLLLRIPTPQSPQSRAVLDARLRRGERLLELADLPIEWSDLRLAFRQTADILLRHDALDGEAHRQLAVLVRDATGLESLVRAWYDETRCGPADDSGSERRPPMFDDVAALALRPFLARTLVVVSAQVEVDAWQRPWCPYCGAAPDFAVVDETDGRDLFCSRCVGRWKWEAVGCPWCATRNQTLLPMFASRDRRYRVYACQVCRRYLKAYDARGARRPVMPAVDGIASLPLDAAAVQQGFGVG